MVTSQQEAWALGRPVYDRLPAIGFKDSPLADVLTQWIDQYLSNKATQVAQFYLELHPDTCQDASLEYLAWLVGLSGPYWDVTWTPAIKRALIAIAHTVLWRRKGTLGVIKTVLDIHGIAHDFWLDGSLLLTFALSGTFGTPKLRYFVRLPLQYLRSEREFREAERTVNNFSPAIVGARVCYERFYLGFSKLGDPLF